MFTDRFIKLPVNIVRKANEDLCIKEEVIASTMIRLNPLEIVSYRPFFGDDEQCDKCVTVELKNSENIVCTISITDFEKKLNEYQK